MDYNNTIDCDGGKLNQQLLSVDDAIQLLIGQASVSTKTTSVGLNDALDNVLAQDVRSNIDVPSFANSAMDGYAINLMDEQINTPGVMVFEITGRIPAGTIGENLGPGTAARIFTGAPIPSGANTVIIQEECELIDNGTKIEIYRPILLNENIRPKGNDITDGAIVLKSGSKIRPQDVAMAASIGVTKLDVIKKIIVGVFFTGDELIEPGNTLEKGQIYNSNSYALIALIDKLGCDLINLGNIEDTIDSTCEALEKLMHNCDIIITTGGVSVGEEDHVKTAVEMLGRIELWRIKIKPGKPLAFGKVGSAAFIGLPGNPVSAIVTFLLLARPFIKKMQGLDNYLNNSIKVESGFTWHNPKTRREFIRVKIDSSTIPAKAIKYPNQGSDVLSSMVWADGLVDIPEKSTFDIGELLNYYPFSEMMS